MVYQVFCLPVFFCWIVKAGPLKRPYSMSTTEAMTITERNKQLYGLREMLTKKETEIAWIKQNIWLVNEMYDRENRETPLFEEMFGG